MVRLGQIINLVGNHVVYGWIRWSVEWYTSGKL